MTVLSTLTSMKGAIINVTGYVISIYTMMHVDKNSPCKVKSPLGFKRNLPFPPPRNVYEYS